VANEKCECNIEQNLTPRIERILRGAKQAMTLLVLFLELMIINCAVLPRGKNQALRAGQSSG